MRVHVIDPANIYHPKTPPRTGWHEVFGNAEDALNGNISQVFLTNIPQSIPSSDWQQDKDYTCGSSALAIALGMKNDSEPLNWLAARGLIDSDNGTWYSGIVEYLATKGYSCGYDWKSHDGQMSGTFYNDITNHLLSGKKVILVMHGTVNGCRNNYWTDGGHYIVLDGIKEDSDMGIDMSYLHPRFRNALEKLKQQCDAAGLALGFSSGYRSAAEQDELYAQGRTKPGSIVTNAKGGTSQHNWGIAADFFQNIKGREWEAWFFDRVGAMAEALGLGWGGRWTDFTDRPHLYLPDWGDMPTALINAYGLHGYDAFRATWGTSTGGSTGGSTSGTSTHWQDKLNYPLFESEATSRAQINLNNYTGAGLEIDGVIGKLTLRAMVMAIQIACNMDYNAGLKVDGYWGAKTEAVLKGHYVEYGESQELVRAVQILLLARGDDPQEIDASFGDHMLIAVKAFQRDTGLTVDGVAGFDTIRKLLFVI